MKKLFVTLLFAGFISFIPSSLHPFITFNLSAQIPSDGLVAWYPFNGNANDESGNGNNGVVNGATLTADRFGNSNSAFSFSSGNKIQLNNDILATNQSSELTFSIWVKLQNIVSGPGSGNTTFDFSDGNCDNCWGYRYSIIQDESRFSLYREGSQGGAGFRISTAQNLQTNVWYFLTAVITNIQAKLYLNGVLISSGNSNTSIGSLGIGASNSKMLGVRTVTNGQNLLNGQLDDFALYNRMLTDSEIQQLFQDQTGQLQQNTTCLPSYVSTDGLVGYWPFCGNANDESGNGNNGTVNGATLTADRNGNANSAYSFNGISDFITVPHAPELDMRNQSLTIGFWKKTNIYSNQPAELVWYGDMEGGRDPYYMATQSDQIYLGRYAGNGLNPSDYRGIASQQSLGWEYITGTFDINNNRYRLYKNGVMLVDSVFNLSSIINYSTSGYNLMFGGLGPNTGGWGQFFNGNLDDIAIYNRLLTSQEIQELYQGALAENPNPLICNITAPNTTLCEGESVTLSVNTTGGAAASSQLSANLQQGLVAYYPFNGNANDESGNGENLQQNGPLLGEDFFGNSNAAMNFNGNFPNYLCSSNGYLNLVNTSLSVSAWIFPNSGNVGLKSILSKVSNTTTNIYGSYELSMEDGIVKFTLANPNGQPFWYNQCQMNEAIELNQWHHVLGVADQSNNTMYLYVDGVLISSNSWQGQLHNGSNQKLFIGASYKSNFSTQYVYHFDGKIDEVALYNRAISPFEIQQLYTAQSYAWSTNATTPTVTVTPAQNTTYTCTVNQGNQTCTASVDITVNPNITNAIGASIIEGETYTLGAQTLTTAGTYTEDFTSAAGCDSTVTLTLSVEPLLTCEITTTATVLCSGQSIDLSFNSQIPQTLSLLDSLTYAGEFGGHYYYFTQFTSNDLGQVGTQLTPLNLQVKLNLYGLDLVAIQNIEENNFVASLIPNNQFAVWIGLNDYVTNGVYVWSDESLPTYFNWRSGEPNNNSGDEDYVIMYGPVSYPGAFSTWNDEPCGEGVGPCNPFLFLVESSYEISQNVTSYSWSNSSTTPTINVSPTTSTTYSCTVTQGNQTCTASVDITVNPNVTNTISASIIEGETYTLGTQTLTTTGTYTEVFTSSTGCDSTVTLTLSVNPLPLSCNITSPITTLCAGESVVMSISASDGIVNYNGIYNTAQDQLITTQFLSFTGPSSFISPFLDAGDYYLEVSGTFCGGSCWNGPREDAAFDYYNNNIVPINYAFTRNEYCPQGVVGCAHPRPNPDIYNANHVYYYPFTSTGGVETIYGVADECCWWDNQGGLTFKIYKRSASVNIIWSTGAPTPTINASPAQTTTYTATVTTSTQTCSDSITITVNPLLTWYADADADGFGNPYDVVQDCNQPQGYISDNTDCNDEDAATYPGASEICDNNRDENCDGVDSLCFVAILGCTDVNACNFNPEANTEDNSCILPQPEICNGLDDNCNGQIDEGLSVANINAVSATTALYPVCSGNSIRSANLNNGANSAVIDGNGNDLWYSFTAQFNTFRAGLSAATGDNDVRLYTIGSTGCLELIETEHEITTGNQVLLSDQLTVGQTYYVAVHNISGAMNASAKICFNHLNASTCDHYYSNNTGIYTSVCNSFKAQYRANAVAYTFDILSATQNNVNQNITPWSYTTTSASTVVARLGTLLPANQGTAPVVYTLKVPVLYSLFDAAGNFENLFAQATTTCTVTLNAEATVALRSSDRCPTNKSLTSTIAPDRTVCGAMRYDWEFTEVLPNPGTAQVVQGGNYTTVFFLSNVPGITVGKTYSVRVRPVHSSGIAGQWGSAQCLRVGSVGMVQQSESESGSVENIESRVASISIYPNPTSTGSFVLHYNSPRRGELIFAQESMTELVMMDITGKVVFKTNVMMDGNMAEIHFGDLESGLYLVDFGGERSRLQVVR